MEPGDFQRQGPPGGPSHCLESHSPTLRLEKGFAFTTEEATSHSQVSPVVKSIELSEVTTKEPWF